MSEIQMRAGLFKANLPKRCALILIVACGLMNGCYERVVGVKGPAADSYNVHEPNLKTRNEAIHKKAHSAPNKTVPNTVAND